MASKLASREADKVTSRLVAISSNPTMMALLARLRAGPGSSIVVNNQVDILFCQY